MHSLLHKFNLHAIIYSNLEWLQCNLAQCNKLSEGGLAAGRLGEHWRRVECSDKKDCTREPFYAPHVCLSVLIYLYCVSINRSGGGVLWRGKSVEW